MSRIDFFLFWFSLCLFFEKKNRIQFGMSLVWLEKMRFGSDIIVIYYLCNSGVVNLQLILQH